MDPRRSHFPQRWFAPAFAGLVLAFVSGAATVAGELANPEFAFDGDQAKPWREMSKAVAVAPADGGGVAVKVNEKGTSHSSFEQALAGKVPPQTDVTFSCDVAAAKPGIGYVQIKLYKDKKEILRKDSPMNGAAAGRLSVTANTGEADRISVHCRVTLSANAVGSTVVFSKAAVAFGAEGAASAAPAAAPTPAALGIDPAKVQTVVNGWRNESPKEQALEADGNGFRISFLGATKLDAQVSKRLAPLPAAGTDMVFSGTVSETGTGLAYLQVKLFKDKKELKRIESKRNAGAGGKRLFVEFNTGDADEVLLLVRTTLKEHLIGQSAAVKDLAVAEGKEPVAVLPRFETVPGYTVCSLYVNRCAADAADGFKGKVFF